MRIPNAPDLGAPRRMALTALAVMLVMGTYLGFTYWDNLDVSLGDTDDATRLVLVRALLSGQGWWSQHMMRFQPPVGAYMHWSRLLDGGIAAMDALFRLALSADDAETATRFIWPLLWIFPAAAATLSIARQLGAGVMGGAAVLVCAIVLASDPSLYVQFRPGRVDHHDVQMTLCFVALAGAVRRGPGVWGAALAGIATALGLAIGLEAIAYDAIIAAGIALGFVVDPQRGRAVQVYGVALLVATLLAFGVQTPPWRWGVVACDALAFNLVAALAVAAAGLVVAATLTRARSWPWRLGALALVGLAAAATYFALYPNCRHGFFADVDPRIRPIWLNFVQEVRPIDKIWKRDQVQAVSFATTWGLGVAAWIGIGVRRARRSDPAWLITGACLIPSVAVAAGAIRMSGYAEWFAIPGLAVAATEAASRFGRNLFTAVLAGAVVTPTVADGLSTDVVKLVQHKPPAKTAPHGKPKPKPKPPPRDECFDTDSYDDLYDAEPAGLVVSEVDLGPFVLANTNHSALSGPYHRMSWGILKAYAILAAPADGAAADLARKAGVTYVLECRFHARHGDRDLMKKDALQKRLDRGQPPAWLKPLSPKDAPLQAYRVLPASAVPPAPPAPAPTPTRKAERASRRALEKRSSA